MWGAEFVPNYPLYRKLKYTFPDSRSDISLPTLHIYCPKCARETTFKGSFSLGVRQQNQPAQPSFANPSSVAGKFASSVFVCASCNDFHRIYNLLFVDDLSCVMKVGQYPSGSIDIDHKLGKILGEYAPLYQKGLICESQSYGMGAYAYYRRIVENVIDQLTDQIVDLISSEEKLLYQEALNQKQSVAERRELLNNILPASLRPNGFNPLDILYEALSVGIHALTDEECLEEAAQIREALVFLIEQIGRAQQSKDASTEYLANLQKLLDKKSQRLANRGGDAEPN